MREFTEQELVRREKAEKLRELGLDPFGQRYDRTDYAKDIKDKYSEIEHDAFENMDDTAKVAGRIMFIRKMGKASFFTIQDKTGSIQIYISINDIGEESYDLFKSADIGDIVGVYGKVMIVHNSQVDSGITLDLDENGKPISCHVGDLINEWAFDLFNIIFCK